MSIKERQQQFKAAIERIAGPDAKLAENYGFSNSARVLQGGLFAGTNNLESVSIKAAAGEGTDLTGLVLLCVLTFPPRDEVYFAITVGSDAPRLVEGLVKLSREVEERNRRLRAEGKSAGRVNNNVKFFLTEGGRLYFSNEFVDELEPAKLDPDLFVAVDTVQFSIWPPAASARRSLLAREFVGYVGALAGREKVHELLVWADEAAVSPSMRRMPATIPLPDIEAAVKALGGHYPGGEVARLHGALNFLPKKHFAILSGLSGSGKTQLALKYARAVHGVTTNDGVDPFLFVCPVRPEWTDPSGLTGYYDVLSDRYMAPPFLQALLLATARRESPVFVVLDEMNLARVEYYFSDILSAIETGEPLQLHSSGVPLEGSAGTSVPASLLVPDNLYIAGTINIDETTNPVSDKVLDRAIVLDMSVIDLPGFIIGLAEREVSLVESCAVCEPYLIAAQDILEAHGLGFGYRVAEEVVRYHAFAAEALSGDSTSALDDLMVQKILVKLRGSERQRPLLTALAKVLAGMPRSEAFLARLTADLDDFGSFQASR